QWFYQLGSGKAWPASSACCPNKQQASDQANPPGSHNAPGKGQCRGRSASDYPRMSYRKVLKGYPGGDLIVNNTLDYRHANGHSDNLQPLPAACIARGSNLQPLTSNL